MNLTDRERTIAIAAGAGLVGIFIVNGAYRSGFNAGLAQSGDSRGYHDAGFDFFPPLPLILLGVIAFIWWRRRQSRPGQGPGPSIDHAGPGPGPGAGIGRGPSGGGGGSKSSVGPARLFEDWHRRAHEADWEAPAARSTPAASAPSEPARSASAPESPTEVTPTASPGGGPPTYV